MITSIAFVPPDHVIRAITELEQLMTQELFPIELEPTITWFTNTYIGLNLKSCSTKNLKT